LIEANSDLPSQMSDLTEEDLSPRTYTPGEIVEGEVVRVDEEGIVVSVGLKMEGMVPLHEMRMLSLEDQMLLEPGQEIAVAIVGGRGPGDMPLLSYDQAQEVRSWQTLRQYLDEGTVVTALVTGQNRGGLEVDCLGIRGFVPFSHLAPTPGVTREEGLAARVKQHSEFNVLEIDRDQNRLVLSERAIWQKAQAEAHDRILAKLEEGAIISGRVSSIRDFGAFVDLGEIDGLIPISELSWKMIKTPDEVVSIGDPVEVYVLRVDPANRRLTLSLKRTQPVGYGKRTVYSGPGDRGNCQQLGPLRRFRKPGRRDRRTGSHLGTVHASRHQPQRMRLPGPESTGYDPEHRYREAPHRIELQASLRNVVVTSRLPIPRTANAWQGPPSFRRRLESRNPQRRLPGTWTAKTDRWYIG